MQKVLAIDIGNSFTKVGLFIEGQLEETECIPTDKADLQILQEDLQEALTPLNDLELSGIVIASVVPSVREMFETLLASVSPKVPILWANDVPKRSSTIGQVNLSDYDLTTLGADRVANLLGGFYTFQGQRLLICDFGTTTTFDLLESDGRFLGGAICPGPRKFQTLVGSHHAAQLFEVDIFKHPEQTPGLNTQSCLENGLFFGYKGIILEVVGNLLQSASWPLSSVTFLFTGGYGLAIRPMVEHEILNVHVDNGLTLKGLYQIWRLNLVPQS